MKTWWLKWMAVVSACAWATPSRGADPLTVYYYPSGLQVGTTNRVIVGGQHLGGLRGGWVSGTGVDVLSVERVPGFPLPLGNGQGGWVGAWLEAVLDGRPQDKPKLPPDEALRGWTRYRLWETMDELPPLELSLVARDHYTPRNVLQMSPALSEMCVVTLAASPDATPGVRDVILYGDAGASAPHPFIITKDPHVPEPLFESPVRRRMREAAQRRAEESGRPGEVEMGHVPPVVFDGQIMPGETDRFRLRLKKGARLTCVLTGRELLPYLGDAVPGFFNPVLHLRDAYGHEVAAADDFHYLPDPVLTWEVAAAGDYVLEVHDNVYRGRQDFVYEIACYTGDGDRPLPTPQVNAFACFPPARSQEVGSVAAPGFIRSDCVDMPGRVVFHDFEVREPDTWEFSLFARRLGSPLDGVLRLYGPMTELPLAFTPRLEEWDDVTNAVFAGSVPQVECDPIGTHAFTRAGRYRIAVTDTAGCGGEEFSYLLRAMPARPTFEVYSVKSSFLMRPWNPKITFKARVVRRNGFTGAVTFDETEDFTFEKGTIPAEASEAQIVAVAKNRTVMGMRSVQFTASLEVSGGGRVKIPVTPGDSVEQAFAYTHLLPARAFHCLMLPGEPRYAQVPEWIDMPADRLFPPRVVFAHTNLPSVVKVGGAAIDAVAAPDLVPVAAVPEDADDGVLAAKFASSAANTVGHRGVVAFEPTRNLEMALPAHAALAGIPRLVTSGFRYADGDAVRVRTLARAATLSLDTDVLLYVSADDSAPFVGPAGAAARRLRDAGWCFDFATDKSLPVNFRGYRAIYVPKYTRPLLKETVKVLADFVRGGGTVLFEGEVPASALEFRATLRGADRGSVAFGRGRVAVGGHEFLLGKDVKTGIRRETFCPEGVRFARYGTRGGEGWYFVHNPTRRPVTGNWRFNLRGNPRTAFMMNVKTGAIERLKCAEKGAFACSLASGESAWFYVSAYDLPPTEVAGDGK